MKMENQATEHEQPITWHEMSQIRLFLQPINYFTRNQTNCADDIVYLFFQ